MPMLLADLPAVRQILLFHNWQFKVMHRKDIERQTAAARTTLQVLP